MNMPRRRRIALADAVFLRIDSADQKAERDDLRSKRQLGLNAMAVASLGAIPAILSASIWQTASQTGARSLAIAAVFFATGFIAAAVGIFSSWFEPALRRKAPEKRFIIGPEDSGDYDEQRDQFWQEEWVDEHAHLAVPNALAWRLVEFTVWVAIVASAIFFATGLLVGGIGVLTDLTSR